MTDGFDPYALRAQFPAFNTPDWVYLDSAATAQKPLMVIDAICQSYMAPVANVHRGQHQASLSTTAQFEQARRDVAHFIDANPSDIIWTRGTTEAINLLAYSLSHTLTAHDQILVSEMEHHANLIPWQLMAQRTGAQLVKIPCCTSSGGLNWEAYQQALNTNTRIVAISHVSNVTGTRHPIEKMTALAHRYGATVIIDGAQGIVHEPISMQTLDADYYVFSGHKLYGPTGIGVLYGKPEALGALAPFHGGGKMISEVTFDSHTLAPIPARFEAGTPNTAGAIGLAVAINWLKSQDNQAIHTHLTACYHQLIDALKARPQITLIAPQATSTMVSFVVQNEHHSDVAELLSQQGIAVRSGHHCAHPFLKALGIDGTIRVSLAAYNTQEDVECFIVALDKALALLDS
ncbi:aminotransferase class V-fold PLP-dependent enzyme [Salinivibrio sp. ES.052]|uniref:aminotransferase class V-fold PLP-dependent enzyme n=1 Tax=Salinivibrio sp. ES.052 TaxID=1882823 RepID=UPI000928E282|nr:cysteine desulfurase [Salinivibrio sp. ES.052]SIO01468.1 cysteine desulfurase [Salinivibrio sp. ES.052]